jgi:hypothetical protein
VNIYTQNFTVPANGNFRLSVPLSRSVNFFSIRDVNLNIATLDSRFSLSSQSAQNYAPVWEGQTVDVGQNEEYFDYIEFRNNNSFDVNATVILTSGVVYDSIGQKVREEGMHSSSGFITVWNSSADALDLSNMVAGQRATVLSNCTSSTVAFAGNVVDVNPINATLYVSRFAFRMVPFDRTKDAYLSLLFNAVDTSGGWGFVSYKANAPFRSEIIDQEYFNEFNGPGGGAFPLSICYVEGLNCNFYIRLYS